MRQFQRLVKDSPGKYANMQLRLALGMTCSTSSCLAVDPGSATVAYPASGVVVLLDIIQCKQKSYVHQAPQQISCVSFSPDGSLLLIGETGYMPALRVWWIQHEVELAKFQEHQYGIISAAFSKRMDIIVSIGAKHDNFIYVWAWPSRIKIACNRFAEDIYAMSFSNFGNFFVTCGAHHVKYWYPIVPNKETNKHTQARFSPNTLYGRPAILREIKHRLFVDVNCGSMSSSDSVFTVTKCGLVCKLNNERGVRMYKRLQNTHLSSLQVYDTKLMVGSKCGHIYFFDAITLQLKASVSLPLDICFAEQVMKCHGCSLEAAVDEHRANMYLAYDYKHNLLTAALNSGSLCVWDVTDWENIKKNYYSVSHSNAITALDVMRSDTSKNKETMVTVSQDGTVRLWNIVTSKGISCESSKTIYTEFDRESISTDDLDRPHESGSGQCGGTKAKFITAVKVSPDRDVLVTGDSKGIISVYDRETLENIKSIMRHTRGVTALDIVSHTYADQRVRLLASGGRDRLINIYNMENDFCLVNCLNVHSGTVTSLGIYSTMQQITLLSSGLDRSLVMCKSERTTLPHFRPCHCRHPASSVIDIVVCPLEALVAVGRINGKISVMDAFTFAQIRRFNGCPNENSRLEKLHMRPSNNLLLTACTDRTINLLSLTHGLLLARVCGNAKGISGLNFSLNMKFIVSTSKDGCIFLWGMPENIIRPGVRLVRSSVQEAEVQNPVTKAVSVVHLNNAKYSNISEQLRFMNTSEKNLQRMFSSQHSPTDSYPDFHKAEEDEESASMEEYSVNDDTSYYVKDFEKTYVTPLCPASVNSSNTITDSSQKSLELTTLKPEGHDIEQKEELPLFE